MEKLSFYLKKTIALFLISFICFYLLRFIPWYFIVPAALLLYAFVYHQFTNEKPSYLFDLKASDQFINKKNGFYVFLKPLLLLVGLIYDLFAWIIWSIYLIFLLVIDTVALIRDIFYWISRAIIWFFKQFVPPVVIIFRFIIHYLVRWPWWIYMLSFQNFNNSFKRTSYFIALWGSVFGLFIVFLFYFLGVIARENGLVWVGVVLAILPVSWSFGEIAFVRQNGLLKAGYPHVRIRFHNGFETLRAILVYILIFLIIFLIQIALYLLGWLPKAGLSLLGISINFNTAISFIMIVISFIIIYAGAILPVYQLDQENNIWSLKTYLDQLSVIFSRFLRFSVSVVPAAFFGFLVLLIPTVMLVLSVYLTQRIKNSVLQTKIEQLEEKKQNSRESLAVYRIDRSLQNIQKYLNYPWIIYQEIEASPGYRQQIDVVESKVSRLKEEFKAYEKEEHENIDAINSAIANINEIDDQLLRSEQLDKLNEDRQFAQDYYASKKNTIESDMQMAETNLEFLKSYQQNFYISFFLTGLWIAIFGGLVLAFLVSYLGNFYYDLYHFYEDGKPTVLRQWVTYYRGKNPNQPLLGFTLLVLIISGFYFYRSIIAFISSFSVESLLETLF